MKTSVLVQFLITILSMSSPTNNKSLVFLADKSSPNPSGVEDFLQTSSSTSSDSYRLGTFQLITVSASDAIIRTLVLVLISALPYRKALITKPFLRRILGYANSPSNTINDLVSTTPSYSKMITAMAERKTKPAAISIYDSILYVNDMSGVELITSKRNPVAINDSENHPRDVFAFNFCSSLNPHTVNPRAINVVHQFECSLRSSHNYASSSVNFSVPIPSVVANQSSVVTFDATFNRLSDTLLNWLRATQMQNMPSARCDSLPTSTSSTTSRSLNFSTLKSSTTIITTALTPKMDMVRFSSSVGSNHTISLDFWIIQPVSTIFLNLVRTCSLLLIALLVQLKSLKLFNLNFQLCGVALNFILFVI